MKNKPTNPTETKERTFLLIHDNGKEGEIIKEAGLADLFNNYDADDLDFIDITDCPKVVIHKRTEFVVTPVTGK